VTHTKTNEELEIESVSKQYSPEEREWQVRSLRKELLDLEVPLKWMGVYDRRKHKREVLEQSLAGRALTEGEGR
jgi:ribosomal protein L29